MLVFIDDSGDPGFKLEKGSTRFFVISMVLFDDELEAERTAVAIKELKRSLGFPDEVEFKFFKSRPQVRKKFLQTVARFNFRVRSIVIDKTIIRSAELRTNKNSFYAYAIKMVLVHNGGTIASAKIKIDGSGDRVFRKSFLTYLRKNLRTSEEAVMNTCTLVDSRANVLIQLADMVAGSVRRSYEIEKKDAREYKKIIASHIEDEWRFQ